MRDPLPISITVSDPWDVGEAANCRQSMVSCYNCRRPTTAARPLVRFDHEIVYRGAAYRYAVAAPRLDSIPLSTVGTRLLILLVALSIPLVMETLKNLWLNWGWSHPFASSVAVALIAVAAWWLFGLIVTLATPQSPTQGASPAPSATPQNIQQSATASDGSTINQVGGDLTINQGGLSDEDRKMLRDLVKKKSVDGMAEFAQRYRHGYLIFGLSPNGGPVTYQGELRDARIDVDWSNLRVKRTDSDRMQISTPTIHAVFEGGAVFRIFNNVENVPFVENVPIPSVWDGMSCELLDAEKGIFLIGFK
jgi:hypothetical protein